MAVILSRPQCVKARWHINASVKLVNIGSDNGLMPVDKQVIICMNVDLFSVGLPGANFLINLYSNTIFFVKKMHLKNVSNLNVLKCITKIDNKLIIVSILSSTLHRFYRCHFKCILWNENYCVLILISLQCVLKGPIDTSLHWFRYCKPPI